MASTAAGTTVSAIRRANEHVLKPIPRMCDMTTRPLSGHVRGLVSHVIDTPTTATVRFEYTAEDARVRHV
jgi:hypothetical protein